MRWVPGWLIVIIVIAAIIFLANKLGIISIHFNIGGSLSV